MDTANFAAIEKCDRTMKKLCLTIFVVAINLFLAIGLIELTFIGFYWLKDGDYVSVYDKLSREKSSFDLEKASVKNPCNKHVGVLYPHPYLAFIHGSRPECNSFANNTGHRGPDVPFHRNPDEYRVMILGGSVANHIYQQERQRFKEYFSKRVPNKKVTIFNGALEGWKQPQQLLMLQFYGDTIDAAISIEGHNELNFNRRLAYNLRFETPFIPGFRKANPNLLNQEEKTVIHLNSKIFEFTLNHPIAKKSKAAYFISEHLRNYFESQASKPGKSFSGIDHLRKVFTLPREWPEKQKLDYHVTSYGKYLNLMHATANNFGIQLAVFFQPAPAIDKVLTEEEKQVTGKSAYKEDYVYFVNQLQHHNQELNLFSLLPVFKDVKETIYKDGIHYHKNSNGSTLVVEEIINKLDRHWPKRYLIPMPAENSIEPFPRHSLPSSLCRNSPIATVLYY